MNSMFDKLLQLPIFMGLTRDQMTEILEKVPFHFQKFKPGEIMCHPGDLCENVTFVLSGKLRQVTPTFCNRVTITQDFLAPHTLSFDNLFGADIHHLSALYAVETTGVMQLSKEHFLKCLQINPILLINTMNILSTHAQKQHKAMDFSGETDPVLRLSSWMLAFSDRPATTIAFDAKVTDWCNMLQLDQAGFWRCVAMLEGEKVVEVLDGKLFLIDRYGLRSFVSRKLNETA